MDADHNRVGAPAAAAAAAGAVQAVSADHNRACTRRTAFNVGRNLLAKNSEFSAETTDERGYVTVEWWIMSKTQCLNDVQRDGEGLTELVLGDRCVRFADAVDAAEDILLGKYGADWPLTKVLDIGGAAVGPSFAPDEVERPPIPAHVHAGDVVCGKCTGNGKLEAYFFPPVDVPPYEMDLSGSVHTRLGIAAGVSAGQVIKCLKCGFGVDDSLYSLLARYPIVPRTNWTIPTHVIHAPGPWPTFEIQLPQDDYNLMAWKLGSPIEDDTERAATKSAHQLRGIANEEELFAQTIKWERNVDPEFEAKWFRDCAAKPLEEGEWGRRLRLFHHHFYGEGFEVNPGQRYERPPSDQPFAGIVWSGRGTLNGSDLNVEILEEREFLVVPGHAATFENSGDTVLLVYTAWPIVS
eukprot:CAMPEP_0206287296 /NCGR_PEP_ID=MMETSP0106_2-20121207/1035_1 /ASSEMBLY_ACC=CAM_ASM_000206 /TAXON_ID=81532 /ORGANISM="Acanthoeca-like sp., Strain 10tr" /LENGTH=408 /DNA_ID=CAMNT_0053717829 /DNA_START=88 /DNA_END=1312 /DNA_ORIENTATION=+